MTAREAYIILNLLPNVGPVRVKQLLQNFDSPVSILDEKEETLTKIKGIGQKFAYAATHWKDYVDIEKELNLTKRAKVDLLTPADPAYPDLLKEIYDPPLCLYLRGNIEALRNSVMLAVVGSRRTTRYGIAMAQRLTASLAHAGYTVVSGLARGIDTVAHTTTLESNGTTIAVLGGGLGHIYPQENVPLAQKICEKGLIMSEQPMLAKPDRRAFPMRNRIIAGLSMGTLVVEAGSTSGSLITAQQALDQGRLVFAVPGRVDSPQSRGCHRLIKDGAILVESFEDIAEEFNMLPGFGGLNAKNEKSDFTRDNVHLKLTDSERQITELLRYDELSVDEITNQLDLPISSLLSILLALEMKKIIYQMPGKRYGLKAKKH